MNKMNRSIVAPRQYNVKCQSPKVLSGKNSLSMELFEIELTFEF